jgi:beta-galactosidase
MWMLSGGTVPELLAVANFGSGIKRNADALASFRKDQPFMCGEFWCGWFDHWYERHHTRTADDVGSMVQEFFDVDGSFNFYMFHGGTNFAFTSGANHYETFTPDVTSYDYDAALTEAGDLTKRFYEVRAVAEKYFDNLPEITVKNTEKKAYGKLSLTESADLFKNLDNLSSPVKSSHPKTMEELGCDFGFTLYSTVIDYAVEAPLIIDPIRDRALIYINGEFKGVKERDRRDDEIIVSVNRGEKVRIDILIENQGRVNYGTEMANNDKGLVRSARLGQQYLFGWTMYPLTMDDLSKLEYVSFDGATEQTSTFFRGTLNIEGTPSDTFMRLDSFHKGFVTVNGFNVGRYWTDAGPTKTLYIPAPILKEGNNEIIVFELHGCSNNEVEFCDVPDLG